MADKKILHMKGKRDISGHKFGNLTAICIVDPSGENKNKKAYWLCVCDCGKERVVRVDHLKSGKIVSCGCYRAMLSSQRYNDLIGMQFGKLTVMEKTQQRQINNIIWRCVCECGKDKYVRSSHLIGGLITHCGCLRLNIKDISGEKFGKLTAVSPTEKRDLNRSVIWECLCNCGNVYFVPGNRLQSGNTTSCGCISHLDSSEWESSAIRSLYSIYKHGAKKRGYAFNLHRDLFSTLLKQNCFYCGSSPKSKFIDSHNKNITMIYNGIDRVDNTKGYEEDNCVTCCGICNRMKLAMNQTDFFRQIRNIYKQTLELNLT